MPTQINPYTLETALRTARDSGMPPDQIKVFLEHNYIPQPKQMRFHALARQADRPGAPDRIAIGGARGPGKSHAIMAQITVDDCQRYPGLDVLFLRKVGKSGKESLDKLRRKTFLHVPHDWNRNTGVVHFTNGSSLIVGNFNNEGDIDKYLGIEYDIIAIEEWTQLSEAKVQRLEGSLRSSKPGWRPRMYTSTNPGGIGHAAFKRIYVTPYRNSTEQNGRTRFIPAGYKDNAFLDAGYIQYLESLTGLLGRMWRDGDWDVGAGMYFTNWNHETHVITPFPIGHNWPVWLSFDYGFAHPTAVYWHTRDGDGTLYTIAEHTQSRWLVPQHAARMQEISAQLKRPLTPETTVLAGHDVFAKRGDSQDKTIADQYQERGITLTRARIDRLAGAANMLKLLGDPERRIAPTWFVFSNCVQLIDTIPAMLSDPHRPEDVLKVDADEEGLYGDDPYDSVRYGLFGLSDTKSGHRKSHTLNQTRRD